MPLFTKEFLKHRPKLSLFLAVLLIFLSTLGFIELGLRLAGFRPGILVNDSKITLVDSLILLNEFATDENGIMRTSPERIQLVKKLSSPEIDVPAYAENHPDGFGDYIGNLLLEFYTERQATSVSKFSEYLKNLKNKPKEQQTEVEQAIIDYSFSPINSNGYRSLEFKNYSTEKKKILLLGDSFAWGMSAKPITNSFADLLLTKDYTCFNTGIPAIDLPQYLATAEKFIPKLRPDFVIVNFFMGNDEVIFNREVHQSKPIYYDTNAGLLFSNPYGCFMEMSEAYQLFIRSISIPAQQEKLINTISAKTALTTLLWKSFNENKWREELAVKSNDQCDAQKQDPPITEHYIDLIQKICAEFNSQMLVILIPEKNQKLWEVSGYEAFKNQANRNFTHINYFYPNKLTDSDFDDDGHFNNSGSEKYADYLDYLMDSIIAEQIIE